jgi:uncharacterized protein
MIPDHLGTLQSFLLVAAILSLAGFVKGVIGFGLPAISVGLLGLMMTPLQAASLLLVPNIVTNVWQMLSGRPVLPLFQRLLPLFGGIAIGIATAEWLTAGKDLAWATRLLGLTLLAYAMLGLFAIRFIVKPSIEALAGTISGILTGMMTLATGVFVIPSGPYLQAIGLEKDELVQAMGMTFLVASSCLGMALFSRGSFPASTAGASLLALVPALAAMVLGQKLRGKISQVLFKKLFFSGMLALGLFLLLKR